MLRRIIITAAFLTAVLSPAAGEKAAEDERDWTGTLFFTMGITQTDKGDLGTSLRNAGFGNFGDRNLYLGAGGYFILNNNLLLGGSGGGIFPAAKTEDYETRFYAAHVTFDAGYAILRKRHFVAYPFGGLGIGSARLTLTDNNPPENFNDYLDGTFHTTTLYRYGIAMKGGGAFEVRIPLTDTGFSLVFGTRGGYVYMPWATDWYFGDVGIGKEPDYRYGGPYVVGFAGVSPF